MYIIFHYLSEAYIEAGGVWRKKTGEEGALTIISIKYKCNVFLFIIKLNIKTNARE